MRSTNACYLLTYNQSINDIHGRRHTVPLCPYRVHLKTVYQFSRKRVQPLKIRKNVKKTKPLRHAAFNYSITESRSVPVSHGHQHQTSCSEVRSQESMQLRTVCDKRL